MATSKTDYKADRDRFVTLFRARHPCLHIVTDEEHHAMALCVGAAVEVDKPVLSWSVVKGLAEGLFVEEHLRQDETQHPAAAMRAFVQDHASRVLVMMDLLPHIDDPVVVRCLREVIEHCRRTRSHLILIDHQQGLPEIISSTALKVSVPRPDAAELEGIAKDTLRKYKDEEQAQIRISKGDFADVVHNLRGLTRLQAAQLIADAVADDNTFAADDIPGLLNRKRRLLKQEGILEDLEVDLDLEAVAGYGHLKEWLANRREFKGKGLPPPRGVLLLGVPGAGKSLCAKAVAGSWRRPLLRLDAGALYDQYIGESERRLRSALDQAMAMAPCVLWIDEIEKAFAGAAARSSDGGLSQRMFGTLLNWMQERSDPVFLVATANDIEALPPELLRKGRFDEIFFVDLPDAETRSAIFAVHLKRLGYDPAAYDLAGFAAISDGFSGAEIEQALIAAGYSAGGGIPGADAIISQLQRSPPLSTTMAERIATLRQWATGRCVPA